ncbi:MAG: hypothetical protein PWP65_1573 [Clostridia bacterium]|nr:hypothetical protein [Clostridia bacterium]
MDFYEVIRARRSIRKYKPEMVPQETILKILKTATMAPSGQDRQQWEFLVLTGEIKK